jgi:hypothetical protein
MPILIKRKQQNLSINYDTSQISKTNEIMTEMYLKKSYDFKFQKFSINSHLEGQ